jgi:predicted AlkP superfamily phosphohydrolase/phosphomutase
MPAGGAGPVVLVGLDACDPLTVRRMAAAGKLPNIAALMAQGARARVRNAYGLFVGATWANFATGAGPERHGFHCWDEIDSATYANRLKPPAIAHPFFWQAMAGSGRRMALIDIPHASFPEPIDGIAVAEWGCHDRHFGLHSQPPGLAAELVARFGLHPVFGERPYAVHDFAPDDHVHRAGRRRTLPELKALRDDLLSGVARKARLVSALFDEGAYDLFVAVFGEAHAAGHQLWHLHDPAYPDFDPAAQRALGGDPVEAVYRALDAAVGELAGRAGPDATVMLLLSHGMGLHHDGTLLLAEILRRLELAYGGAGRYSPRDLFRRGSQALVPAADRVAAALRLPPALRFSLGRKLGARQFCTAGERRRQAFFAAPNNHVYGGIRFNRAGREAKGWLDEPAVEALTERLESDLRKVINLRTGRPAIRAVVRAGRLYARSDADSMPDLFIDWHRSAPIEAVRSPSIGIVRAPYDCWRSGDHRLSGQLIVRAPGLPAGRPLPRIAMEDIPVTIAAALGVALSDADGAIIPWLASAAIHRPRRPRPGSAGGGCAAEAAPS